MNDKILSEMERIALMLNKVVLHIIGCNVETLTENDLNEVEDILYNIKELKETGANENTGY